MLEKSNEFKHDAIKVIKYLKKAEKYDRFGHLPTFLKAGDLFNEGKFKQAIKLYNLILQGNKTSTRALIELGICYENICEIRKAIECYNSVLEINPKSDSALNNKGIALSNLGNHKEAIDCFDRILQLNPSDKIALDNKEKALKRHHLSEFSDIYPLLKKRASKR